MKSISFPFRSLIVAALALCVTASAHAQAFKSGEALVDPLFQGNVETSVWTNLSSVAQSGVPGQTGSGTIPGLTGTGGFPGSAPWSGPAKISQGGGGNAELIKVSNGTGGGPYAATESIYYGGFSGDVNSNGGTLAVKDASPLAGLKQIAFQIQIGEASGFDFFNNLAPVLKVNGLTTAIAHTVSTIHDQFYNGTFEAPTGTENLYINTYQFDWDIDALGITDPITEFQVEFTGVQHAQLYSLRLDQSDYAPAAIPEPGSMLLLGSSLLFGIPMEIRKQAASDDTNSDVAA